jgi:hypothetical protein
MGAADDDAVEVRRRFAWDRRTLRCEVWVRGADGAERVGRTEDVLTVATRRVRGRAVHRVVAEGEFAPLIAGGAVRHTGRPVPFPPRKGAGNCTRGRVREAIWRLPARAVFFRR